MLAGKQRNLFNTLQATNVRSPPKSVAKPSLGHALIRLTVGRCLQILSFLLLRTICFRFPTLRSYGLGQLLFQNPQDSLPKIQIEMGRLLDLRNP